MYPDDSLNSPFISLLSSLLFSIQTIETFSYCEGTRHSVPPKGGRGFLSCLSKSPNRPSVFTKNKTKKKQRGTNSSPPRSPAVFQLSGAKSLRQKKRKKEKNPCGCRWLLRIGTVCPSSVPSFLYLAPSFSFEKNKRQGKGDPSSLRAVTSDWAEFLVFLRPATIPLRFKRADN